MTFNEYIEDQKRNPGRRYLMEEGPDDSTVYTPIEPTSENPYARKLALKEGEGGKEFLRRQKVRQLFAKRVSKPEKPFVQRLGYNICTTQYSTMDEISTLSGSSMNRKTPAKKAGKKKSAENPQHVMSRRSKGRIRDKASAFFRSMDKDRIFITLTFIQHVSDQEGNRILNKFLTVIRKEIPDFLYLRIAEHQNKRKEKTIHFHLLANRKLAIQRYNNLWVLQQYNAGLVGRSKTCGCKKRCDCEMWGPEISKQEIQARYDSGTIQQVLNPVDVERAYCISGLSWYLTKYVTKQETGESFGCLTWHCSRRVSRLFTAQVVSPSTFRYMLSFRNWKVDRRTGECWAPREINGKFFSLVFINNKPAVFDRLRMLEAVNKWIIEKRIPDKLSRGQLMYMNWDQYMNWIPGGPVDDPKEAVAGDCHLKNSPIYATENRFPSPVGIEGELLFHGR